MCPDAAWNWICCEHFGKVTKLCHGEAASVPLLHMPGKGKVCHGGHLEAAKKPGRKGLESQEQKEGGSGWLQGKRRGEGVEKVPPIIDLWQLSLYLTICKKNILVPLKNWYLLPSWREYRMFCLWKNMKLPRQYVSNYSYCDSKARLYLENHVILGDTDVFLKIPTVSSLKILPF